MSVISTLGGLFENSKISYRLHKSSLNSLERLLLKKLKDKLVFMIILTNVVLPNKGIYKTAVIDFAKNHSIWQSLASKTLKLTSSLQNDGVYRKATQENRYFTFVTSNICWQWTTTPLRFSHKTFPDWMEKYILIITLFSVWGCEDC